MGIQARGAGLELQELDDSKCLQKAGTCNPGKNEPYSKNPSIAPSVISASQGKEGGFCVLKAGSFVLVWTEDEFTPNLGKLQAAPWETESGDLLLVRFQPQEVPPGWRGARQANLLILTFCCWIFAPPWSQRWVNPEAALGCSEGSGAAPWGLGLTRGGGCTVLPWLGAGEWGLSCTVQRCAVNRRKQMHTDLQWPSRVLHCIVTATPGMGTSPKAPLLPCHCEWVNKSSCTK